MPHVPAPQFPKVVNHQDPDVLFDNDEISSIREIYNNSYETINLRIEMESKKAFLAFNNLPEEVLPKLPIGYQWARSNDKYSIIKKKNLANSKLVLVLYGPNKESHKINYVFQVDGVTTYSLAHTNLDDGSLSKSKIHQKLNFHVDGFEYNYIPGRSFNSHIKGHMIDHQDTITSGDEKYWSTNDSRNYVPEPPERQWGMDIRRLKIADLRKQGDTAYIQFSQYGKKPLITEDGTAVPDYVYLYSLKILRDGSYTKNEVYHVKFDEDLSRPLKVKVLEHARENLTTSPEAAPVVKTYDSTASDRALRYKSRSSYKISEEINDESISSRLPELDAFYARYDAGDFELKKIDRQLTASVEALNLGIIKKALVKEYIYSAFDRGESLLEVEEGVEIVSPQVFRSSSSLFKEKGKKYEGYEEMEDCVRKLFHDQSHK